MNSFQGEALSWQLSGGVIELTLHRGPCNEIGSLSLAELEKFADALGGLAARAHALILHSTVQAGFCAGADLRELYSRSQEMKKADAVSAVRDVTFGGGFELALVCDLIIADKMARFCFPELRLGLIPGFGGIPRLKRDLGNAVVRDLLLTGRSFNATRAQAVGLVSQVVGEGEALRAARATAAQLAKFDRNTAIAAKKFIKPIPYDELKQEIELFCRLFAEPAVEAGLRRFVESTDLQPYLP